MYIWVITTSLSTSGGGPNAFHWWAIQLNISILRVCFPDRGAKCIAQVSRKQSLKYASKYFIGGAQSQGLESTHLRIRDTGSDSRKEKENKHSRMCYQVGTDLQGNKPGYLVSGYIWQLTPKYCPYFWSNLTHKALPLLNFQVVFFGFSRQLLRKGKHPWTWLIGPEYYFGPHSWEHIGTFAKTWPLPLEDN